MGPRVSSTCSLSVRLERIRLETREPFSLSGTDLTQTTYRQSGEISNPDADSLITTSSTVQRAFSSRAFSAAVVGESARAAIEVRTNRPRTQTLRNIVGCSSYCGSWSVHDTARRR